MLTRLRIGHTRLNGYEHPRLDLRKLWSFWKKLSLQIEFRFFFILFYFFSCKLQSRRWRQCTSFIEENYRSRRRTTGVRDLEARGSVREREVSFMRSSSARPDRTHGGRDIYIGKLSIVVGQSLRLLFNRSVTCLCARAACCSQILYETKGHCISISYFRI